MKEMTRRAMMAITSLGALAAAGAQMPAAAQDRSVWDGVYTAEQAARGGLLYATECAACHGPELEGGETAPPLEGREFVWKWNGLTVGDLFERLRVSMPQDGPSRVSRTQKADILAYLFSRNKFPVGEADLASRTAWLNQIRFDAVKR